jgi:tetratricopeptide (TPR) repeat protein
MRWLKALALLYVITSGDANASPPALSDIDADISAWDLTRASVSVSLLPQGTDRQIKEGVLAVYEADYARAEDLLTRALASDHLDRDAAIAVEARHYLALARGAQRALARAITLVSPDRSVMAVFADPKDTIIAPYLFQAMSAARVALADDLGITPDHPVRIEILDDPAKLALVTTLTLDNIYTTGTIGVTKYRRIVMTSPRVLLHGYPWLDTAVHEYVHYLVTLRTRNLAPVWLQEGLAKLFEERWRSRGPAELDPAAARLLARALDRGTLVTLAEMSPSIAMLPSQERAALAYAEVQTMLTFILERRGPAGITRILDRVAAGDTAEDALGIAWGDTFDHFMANWAGEMKRRTAGASSRETPLRQRRFRDPDDDANAADPSLLGDIFSHLGGGRARQHARLGVLLSLRGHTRAAIQEYERARSADPQARKDPKLARRLGELYLSIGQPERALPHLDLAASDDPEQPILAAAQGRARLRLGDREGARAALSRAIRINPFIPTIHCDLAELALSEAEAARERSLCDE